METQEFEQAFHSHMRMDAENQRVDQRSKLFAELIKLPVASIVELMEAHDVASMASSTLWVDLTEKEVDTLKAKKGKALRTALRAYHKQNKLPLVGHAFANNLAEAFESLEGCRWYLQVVEYLQAARKLPEVLPHLANLKPHEKAMAAANEQTAQPTAPRPMEPGSIFDAREEVDHDHGHGHEQEQGEDQ